MTRSRHEKFDGTCQVLPLSVSFLIDFGWTVVLANHSGLLEITLSIIENKGKSRLDGTA